MTGNDAAAIYAAGCTSPPFLTAADRYSPFLAPAGHVRRWLETTWYASRRVAWLNYSTSPVFPGAGVLLIIPGEDGPGIGWRLDEALARLGRG